MHPILWEDLEEPPEMPVTEWLENVLHDVSEHGLRPLFLTVPPLVYERLKKETLGYTRIMQDTPVFESRKPFPKTENYGSAEFSAHISYAEPGETPDESQRRVNDHLHDLQPLFHGEKVIAMYLGFTSALCGHRLAVLRKFDLESGVTVFLAYGENEALEFEAEDTITDAPDITEN